MNRRSKITTLGVALALLFALTLTLALAQDELPEGFNQATVDAAVGELFAATATAEAEYAAAMTAQAAEALPATATVQAAFNDAVMATTEARLLELLYASTPLNEPLDLNFTEFHHTEKGDPAIGSANAAVTIVEYSDFSCYHCRRFLSETLPRLLDEYEGQVRFVYRDFPVLGEVAASAAVAAECADEQGKFWEYHNLLFSNPGFDKNTLLAMAYRLDLDMNEFEACLVSDAIIEEIQADVEDAQALDVNGTPSFTINGEFVMGAQPFEVFQEIIALALDPLPVPTLDPDIPQPVIVPLDEMLQWDDSPEMMIDPEKEYTATFVTAKGDIAVQLFAADAPITVNNFVFLAREGYYDNTSFHRVLDDFMAQGGDPSGTARGGPGYQFEDETDNGLVFDRPGLLAMANSGIDTNGSQFFITLVPTGWLDGDHTIFGEVIEGMEVLDKLTRRDPNQNPPFLGDALVTIEISEK